MVWRARNAFAVSRLLIVVGLLAVLTAGCGEKAPSTGANSPGTARQILSFADPDGWSLRYPSSLVLEQSSGGGPGLSIKEVTVASFAQKHALVSHTDSSQAVGPPLTPSGLFPSNGVAFRMLVVQGSASAAKKVLDKSSRLPIRLSTFARSAAEYKTTDYTEHGVPHERTRPIIADGFLWEGQILIGPKASAAARATLARVVNSLTFSRRAGS